MDDQIMVSVIVLTYNHEKYIRQALDSILMQEVNFRYEILVGDDASTDNTGRIAKDFAEGHPDKIRYFRHEKNVGAAYNAFFLLMRSRGEYLAYCEGDDYWIDKDKLKSQVTFLEKNSKFIGCAHKCLLVDENGCALRKQRLPWLSGKKVFTFAAFSGGRFLPGQTSTIVKRNIFLESDADWSLMYSSNKEISDRIAAEIFLLRGDFYCFDKIMSAYRRVEKSGLTNKVFKENRNLISDEFAMTLALEKYATEIIGRRIRFSQKRSEIFVSALAKYIKHRDSLAFRELKKALHETKFTEAIITPFFIIRKFFLKTIYK